MTSRAIAEAIAAVEQAIDQHETFLRGWVAFNNAYSRAREHGLPPERAWDEAAEARDRAMQGA